MLHKPTRDIYYENFDVLYAQLNSAQKQAVDAIDGPVMVIAGPGTGKTTILTLRIANILRMTDTAPQNILALTFTESGAFAMRKKLLDIIGPAAYKVNIHTFHGFAEKIIREYPDYFPKIIGSSIITDAEQLKIVENIVQSQKFKILRPFGDKNYYVKPILHEIHLLKRENISPKQLKDDAEKDISNVFPNEKITDFEKRDKRNKKNLELACVYAKYEQALLKHKYYDFDDMLLELIRVIHVGHVFKLMLQETYQYVLADEHQDANAAQNEILELLVDFHDSPNLFIVGDDKQAIYRFQGASLENFLYFTKKYKDANVISLEHNYRSHQGILDSAHSLIANNPTIPNRRLSKLVSLQMGSKLIHVDEYQNEGSELAHLALIIEKMIFQGEDSEEIAVLYRENKNALSIADALRANGIACRIESEYDILGDIDTAKILILCRAIMNPSLSDVLAKALLIKEMNCDSGALSHLCGLSNREKIPLFKLIKSSLDNDVKPIKDAYSRINKWSNDSETIPFPEFLEKLIRETKMIESIVSSSNSLERLSSLETFFNVVAEVARSKKTLYLSDFMEYVEIVSEHGIMIKRTFSEHIKGVRLMTAHRAKGLEFNHVFIVHAIDGLWGNRSMRNLFNIPIIEHARDTGRIDDERRLFYVAMTRARESVTISYSKSFNQKPSIPSQFLSEIDKSLINFETPRIKSAEMPFLKKFDPASITYAPKIIDPEFVRNKFLSQALSVTHLNNYIECAWKYFFVNLLRIPQAESKHQLYGTAIHLTLKTFFDLYKNERDMTKKKLIDLFKRNMSIMPLSLTDKKESIEKGVNALQGYFGTYYPTWNRNILTEYAVKGVELKLPEVLINDETNGKEKRLRVELSGKLDKIEFMENGYATVVDFKTSRPKSRNDIEGKTATSQGNYKRQLVFYKLLLNNDLKGIKMKYGEIDFIEPNEKGIYKKEIFTIDDNEIEDIKKSIIQMAGDILNLSFVRNYCNDKNCPYCNLGKILIF